MADIQFNEEQDYSRPVVVDRQPALIRLVLKTGVVQTEEAARYVLIGVSLAAFIATGFVLAS